MKSNFQFLFLFYFIFIIISNFQKSSQFYSLQYGNVTIEYFNDSSCENTLLLTSFDANDTSIIPCGYKNYSEDELDNCDSIAKFEFDFFSSAIQYYLFNKSEIEDGEDVDIEDLYDDDEDDKLIEGVYSGALTCNAGCYKNHFGDYNNSENFTGGVVYDYYSCLYTNIIKSATIKVTNYKDKNCRTATGSVENYTGKQYCYPNNNGWSLRLLYYEDKSDKLYFHNYTKENCKGESFQINKDFYKCNNKCNKIENGDTYYKCEFHDNKARWVGFNKILFLFLLINYLL